MNLRPYHEHPLLADFSEWKGADYYFAHWFCPVCKLAIVAPPFEMGEYVVDHELIPPTQAPWLYKRVWRVHMRSNFARRFNTPLFESPNRRVAIKEARALERNRQQILRALAGDPQAIAENQKEVERLRQNEKNES